MNIIKKYGQQIDLDELIPDLLLLVNDKIRTIYFSNNELFNNRQISIKPYNTNKNITYEEYEDFIRCAFWFNYYDNTHTVKIDIPIKKVI